MVIWVSPLGIGGIFQFSHSKTGAAKRHKSNPSTNRYSVPKLAGGSRITILIISRNLEAVSRILELDGK